jgi:hypothetical protein
MNPDRGGRDPPPLAGVFGALEGDDRELPVEAPAAHRPAEHEVDPPAVVGAVTVGQLGAPEVPALSLTSAQVRQTASIALGNLPDLPATPLQFLGFSPDDASGTAVISWRGSMSGAGLREVPGEAPEPVERLRTKEQASRIDPPAVEDVSSRLPEMSSRLPETSSELPRTSCERRGDILGRSGSILGAPGAILSGRYDVLGT